MSRSNYFRSWMDRPHQDPVTNLLTPEFAEGLSQFMSFATNQSVTLNSNKMYCPCPTCCNNRFITVSTVWKHLYRRGFMLGYKIWYIHGELESMVDFGPSTSQFGGENIEEAPITNTENVGVVQMVNDRYRETIEEFHNATNVEGRDFFRMTDGANKPLYDGCEDGLSPLYAATRLMSIKTDFNLPEDCVDRIAEWGRDLLPKSNSCPSTYYEVQKLVAGLGLPYEMIDVCIDNCMIFWREDSDRVRCRYCQKPRFEQNDGKSRVPFKRMWYLPLTDRLRRLFQSERTAASMRWHAEHITSDEITHPSDAKAWKHFQSTYPTFASENRNVYLGLSTDGFNPFGRHGRQYSLWPVIVTPYNLPPSLCMKREFLFLTVLIPGPDHPKRSLDVFLQPLIHELQMLWEHGERVFDVASNQDFIMRAVLMWTISDFPAFGMLSGWTTHGRLSCPHCQDNTNAFQLKHGRKSCWFDCHRRFLPSNHPYRRSKTLFRKNVKVFEGPPPIVTGREQLTQLNDFGAEKTVTCGGNGHSPTDGYGEYHNWHKKSIFWELPYWKDLLLRHNLDIMHIEKNFFDNIMNTVLNVEGKTKDNLKSRLDLPDICSRKELHLMQNGKGPIPVFRLDKAGKDALFTWIIHSLKFPDGYASNLQNCVDDGEGKFIGMKSHDCHVFMQRLLPFTFACLLPPNVHRAIADVGAFFRDICSRTLSAEGIDNLEKKIPVILCNLEKKFPPSFFDVMEHLAVHLPREAALGGPVQYRWMYPFERYMFHLKKKVKNLSRVEGSIVSQCINEETSHLAEYYFPSHVQTKSRKPSRHDDGGEKLIYPVDVPDIFAEVGRLSGKAKNRRLTEDEYNHLHTYIIFNSKDILQFERIYNAQVRAQFPLYTEEMIGSLKEREFTQWLTFYVKTCVSRGIQLPDWLVEMINGPFFTVKSYPRYCTRGYAFRVHREDNLRTTTDSGISARAGDITYYGILREILEIKYPGMIGLRCVVFVCDWYDPFNGLRIDEFGVTSVHSRKRLPKYDPFILGSQADQVCYIPYPRVTNKQDPWITVTSVCPRGRVYSNAEQDPLQQKGDAQLCEGGLQTELDVDLILEGEAYVLEVSEDEGGEFDDDTSSIPSTSEFDSE